MEPSSRPGIAALLVYALLVGACGVEETPRVPEDARVRRTVGTERACIFEDAERALPLIGRFLDSLEPGFVTLRGADTATVGAVELAWRQEGAGLHVVALPSDPRDEHRATRDLMTCLRLWAELQGLYGESGEAWMVSVRGALAWNAFVDAAEQEFGARGIVLEPEQIQRHSYVLVARGAAGMPRWAVMMDIHGERDIDLGVCCYEDPFDRATEALLTAAIVERALADGVDPDEVHASTIPSWADVAPEQLAAAAKRGVPVAFESNAGVRFVLIPAGTFLMGSPDGEQGRADDETQHRVTIGRPFYMQVYATDVRPILLPEGDDAPERMSSWGRVSHDRAVTLAGRLSRMDPARSYRLPTEAEWEYACRAGTQTRFWWGDDRKQAPEGLRHDVEGRHAGFYCSGTGSLANPWGLRGMVGGYGAERCADWYGAYPPEPTVDPVGSVAGEHRVVRGGGGSVVTPAMRSAARDWEWSSKPMALRLVSPLPEPSEQGR